jgi:putative hydrolase of the HAD superfamily
MTVLAPSAARSLSHITDWVFDLDNTLYPRTCNLFAQIDVRITHYVMDVTQLPFDEARALQKVYYREFGTTLNGLMKKHTVDPEHFLNTVHNIDYSPVDAHPDLASAIRDLPGRKFIFTNGDVPHARSVLRRLGADDIFEHVYDIKAMTYVPKPEKQAYDGFFSAHDIDPTRAVMFDDLHKNLIVPHEVGMSTVQVVAAEDWQHNQVDAWEMDRVAGQHVHHVTDDLAAFLRKMP